jgi:hypothetical protein
MSPAGRVAFALGWCILLGALSVPVAGRGQTRQGTSGVVHFLPRSTQRILFPACQAGLLGSSSTYDYNSTTHLLRFRLNVPSQSLLGRVYGVGWLDRGDQRLWRNVTPVDKPAGWFYQQARSGWSFRTPSNPLSSIFGDCFDFHLKSGAHLPGRVTLALFGRYALPAGALVAAEGLPPQVIQVRLTSVDSCSDGTNSSPAVTVKYRRVAPGQFQQVRVLSGCAPTATQRVTLQVRGPNLLTSPGAFTTPAAAALAQGTQLDLQGGKWKVIRFEEPILPVVPPARVNGGEVAGLNSHPAGLGALDQQSRILPTQREPAMYVDDPTGQLHVVIQPICVLHRAAEVFGVETSRKHIRVVLSVQQAPSAPPVATLATTTRSNFRNSVTYKPVSISAPQAGRRKVLLSAAAQFPKDTPSLNSWFWVVRVSSGKVCSG